MQKEETPYLKEFEEYFNILTLHTLHEDEFLNYRVVGNDLIFRVAVDCYTHGILEEVGYKEKLYLYDIICHNFKMLYTNYDDKMDIYGDQILGFGKREDYYFMLIDHHCEPLISKDISFEFTCDFVEPVAIKLTNFKELGLE